MGTAPDALLGKRLIAATRLARYERAVERALLTAVRHQLARSLTKLRSVTADAVPEDMFDEATWTDELERSVRPVVEGVFAEVTSDATRFFVGPGQLPEIDLTARVDATLRSMRNLSPRLSRAIGRELTTGINAGESIDKLTGRVRDVFGTVGESSARRIARTETHGAVEGASHEAALALHRGGVTLEKQWLTSIDGRERRAHRRAHLQVVAIDQPFTVADEQLDYPGDPSGSAANIINCRCSTLSDEAGAFASGEDARP